MRGILCRGWLQMASREAQGRVIPGGWMGAELKTQRKHSRTGQTELHGVFCDEVCRIRCDTVHGTERPRLVTSAVSRMLCLLQTRLNY